MGSVLVKTDNADPPEGACVGKVSPAPMFVGLNVPDVSGPGSGKFDPAASFSVIVRFVTPIEPPTSDIMIAFAPVGPTSRKSASSGNAWL